MALTDLLMPVTAQKIGPATENRSRPKVYYLNSRDFRGMKPNLKSGGTVLFVNDRGVKKIEIAETPIQFQGIQAMSQGATASAYVTTNYGTITPTSSATAADQTVISKYFSEAATVNGGSIRLPDPFVQRLAVVQNTTTGTITVRARGTTSAIDGSTAGYVIQGGERVHFLAPTAATAGTTAGWRTAADVGV